MIFLARGNHDDLVVELVSKLIQCILADYLQALKDYIFLLIIRYESLFSYEPCNSDELGLEIGDKVVVVERCDDGWFMGTCERTGEFGAFPGNFVRKLDD